ncbi:unnamed protein product [Phytomonas sp. EM1]|nr:unnamed protein product [Phytomonas sp. EM1]|eukprot:CCW63061.1 unnamed protein product [Phytomonas sp. isolate EM1]
MQRGLVHNSQATQDQTGQLRYRRRVLHDSAKGALGAMPILRPAIASWSYLIPSLKTSVETAVPASIWERLQEGYDATTSTASSRLSESNPSAGETAYKPLSEADRIALQEGQRWFRYELHQRLPLLEDSLAHAELKHLVEWPWLFRRVWLVLPLSPSTSAERMMGVISRNNEGLAIPGSERRDLPARVLSLPSFLEERGPSGGVAGVGTSASVDQRPTALQIYNLVDRVRVLTAHVEACVGAQLASLSSHCDGGEGASPDGASGFEKRSPRSIAKEAELRRKWKVNLTWHQEMSDLLS